jgi:hypothetical protein
LGGQQLPEGGARGKDSTMGRLSLGTSLTTAIPFSFHLLLSASAHFAGILHSFQKRLGGPIDFPSFGRWNFFLYCVEEFRKTDPDPFANLFPLRGQSEVQSTGIILRPCLYDQPPPDKWAYHPGGRAFLHRKNVMELRQGDLFFPGYGMKNEELGKSQVQTERFFLLAAAQGPRQLPDERENFLVRLRYGNPHGCTIQPSARPVKIFLL